MDEGIERVKKGVEIIGEIIKTAGENENVKAAGSELGKTALIVTQTINTALLPLAAVNFAFEKARVYFSTKFQTEIEEKTKAIPPEALIDPKPIIAGPALQGLAFAHEEAPLKEMYLNLIAAAMDKRSSDNVHPAFIEIIKQMDSDEAKFVHRLLRTSNISPIAEIRVVDRKAKSWVAVYRHLIDIRNADTREPIEHWSMPAYVDNWIRLGLATVDYTHTLSNPNTYDWIEGRPELARIRSEVDSSTHDVKVAKGGIARTTLGERFAQSVGIV